MIEVEAPDGSIVEFPDGTADDVMAGAMRARFGGPQASAAAEAPAAVGAPAAVSAPPSASDLDAMIREQAPTAPEPPRPPPTMSERAGGLVSSVLGVLDQGVRGAARGAVGLAGIPVDLVNQAPRLLNIGLKDGPYKPFSDNPVFGSDFNRRALDYANERTVDVANAALPAGSQIDYPRTSPDGPVERIANRVGEEFGAMALPVGAALGTAARVGREGARELPALARMMVEPAAVNPGRFVAKEGAAATTAGTGAGLVNELTRASGAGDDSLAHHLGDFSGALGGLGLFGITSHVAPKIGDVGSAIFNSQGFRNQVSKDAAVDTIAEAYGLPSARLGAREPTDVQPIIDAITSGRRIDDTIPGYQESLADRTGNDGLAGLEYARQAAGGGAFATRNRNNVKAVDDAIQANAPDGSPGAFRGALENRRTQMLQGVSTEAAAARTRFDEASDRLRSAMHADARGADIRAPLEDALTAARDVERTAWEGIGGELPAAPLAARFGRIGGAMTEPEGRIVGDMAGAIGTPGRLAPRQAAPDPLGAMTGSRPPAPPEDLTDLREITSLRSEFTTAQRQAATQGDGNKARLLGQYIDAIDAHLAEHAPQAQAAIDAARGVSRDLNDRFTRPQTAVAQTLNRTEGQYRLPDSGVPGRFVVPDDGRVADFEALMREAGQDPRARAALTDQVRADVERLRGPDQIDAYVRTHSRVLGAFPELRQQIDEASGLSREAAAAGQRETEMTGQLGTPLQPGTSSIGRYLRYGDEASTTAMRGVMNAPKPAEAMNELLNFAGNTPEAVEGAKRTFWDIMEGRARSSGETTSTIDSVQPWKGAALRKFLAEPRNRAVAERLYRDNPEHLRNVEAIAEAMQRGNTAVRARAPGSSGTSQGVSQILSPETIQSRIYAYKRGQVSGTFLITAMAAVAARRSVASAQAKAIGRMVDEALTNPEAAAILLRENNPANRAIMARSAKGWIGNEAGTLVDALDGDDEDPVHEAVTRRSGTR